MSDEHRHYWIARSDIGRAVYSCECGEWGRRSLDTGQIRAHVRPEGYATPPVTVDFKALGDNQNAEQKGCASMRRTHSTRNTAPKRRFS